MQGQGFLLELGKAVLVRRVLRQILQQGLHGGQVTPDRDYFGAAVIGQGRLQLPPRLALPAPEIGR